MKTVKSSIIPLPYSDLNTDLIFPTKHLTTLSRNNLGAFLFLGLRKMDRAFPLNKKKYRRSSILVTRRNFGCGSSRNHAVWALIDWGIRAVIAPSFSDIFYSNAVKSFLLPVAQEAEIVERIFAAERCCHAYTIEIDLEKERVILPGGVGYSFFINNHDKHFLINEISYLDLLLSKKDKIVAFDRSRELFIDNKVFNPMNPT